jgi:CheY-like chemotaxis protein
VVSVLVVDDEANICEFMRIVLHGAGFAVTVAKDGREALKEIESGKHAVVVTDLIMPEHDGLELIASLKRMRSQIHIIAMSGGGYLSADHYLNIAKGFQVDRLLAKPFLPAALVKLVNDVLAGGPPAQFSQA